MTVLQNEVNFLAVKIRVNVHHSDVTVSSLGLNTQHTHYSACAARIQKTCMLKRRSYKCMPGKNTVL